MSITEWHELFKIVFIAYVIVVLAGYLLSKYAEISYKKARKNVKKVHKKATKNVNIVFDIGDTSKMNLFEIKQLKSQMEKELRGNA